MTGLLDLAKRMEKLAGTVGDAASEHAKKTAEVILKDLVYVTPVDTSKALSNWQIGLGAPPPVERGPFFAGLGGSTADRSAAAALKAGLNVLKDKKAGVSIFITNNASYIGFLNDGSSKQAPAGFVERAVVIGRKFARNYKG